jgi:hypothetical protein
VNIQTVKLSNGIELPKTQFKSSQRKAIEGFKAQVNKLMVEKAGLKARDHSAYSNQWLKISDMVAKAEERLEKLNELETVDFEDLDKAYLSYQKLTDQQAEITKKMDESELELRVKMLELDERIEAATISALSEIAFYLAVKSTMTLAYSNAAELADDLYPEDLEIIDGVITEGNAGWLRVQNSTTQATPPAAVAQPDGMTVEVSQN